MTGNRSAAARLALVGAVASLVLLSGCGRKAGLDLPPNAGVAPAAAAAPAPESPQMNPLGALNPYPEEEKPRAAPGQKKRIILDPILD